MHCLHFEARASCQPGARGRCCNTFPSDTLTARAEATAYEEDCTYPLAPLVFVNAFEGPQQPSKKA
eukprot:10449141-Alexandrium_andersonii.AAC.1